MHICLEATMKDDFNLEIKKTISVWNRELAISPKELFISLAKSTMSGISLDYNGFLQNLTEVVNSISIDERPAYAAYTLIYRSLTDALSSLIQEYHDLFSQELGESEILKISDALDIALSELNVSINSDLFNTPKNLPLLEELKPHLVKWLMALGMSEAQSIAFHLRLKSRFPLSLHMTWVKNPTEYGCIEDALNSPFVKASKYERCWMQYRIWLDEQTKTRMFSEAFSLSQVYVPLRAYFNEKDKDTENKINDGNGNKVIRHVVDLHSELEYWVRNFDPERAIRIVSGGPGSGKSSFGKMFAAFLSKNIADVPILFIPLHQFDPSDDLTSAVEKYVRDDRFLTGSPLDVNEGQERLLIIFDGLDELSMQGKAAAETANFFIDEVIAKINKYNGQHLKRQVLITGRDLAIQSTENKLRGEKQVLHVLPYYISEDDASYYNDPDSLLEVDQRDIWWRNYGQAKGITYPSMPEQLKTDRLYPITREPLLNYLVALSHERNKISLTSETTLNTIYQDLLDAVHERQWDHGKHKGASHLESHEFTRILEEIALAVWHGDGRTATVNQIYSRCQNGNLSRYLDVFEEGAKRGVSRLLTAFYFRQSEQLQAGDKTFEFTHKSFGEFLIARRIVRAIKSIHNEIMRHDEDPDLGYDEKEGLKRWAELGGPTAIDQYVFEFLCDEIKSYKSEAEMWQGTLIRLLSYAVKNSMPMEMAGLPRFRDMMTYSRNAEELLVAAHSACAKVSGKVKMVEWGPPVLFGEWLKRIQGQRTGPQNTRVVLSCLECLDLNNRHLDLQDFFLSVLKGCNFSSSFVRYCNFNRSNLTNASFNDALLEYSSFINADISSSTFLRASVEKVNFQSCSIENVDFSEAEVEKTNFYLAVLISTNFHESHIDSAVFTEAKIYSCDFSNLVIENTNFIDCKLDKSDFSNAEFENCTFDNIDFTTSNITGANFNLASLNNVSITNSQLKSIVIDEARKAEFIII